MKHAAVLYTCIGLMGTAAIAGFADYTQASKSGLLNGLYSAKKNSSVTTLIEKKVDIDDYSRGPIEEFTEGQVLQSDVELTSPPRTPKKPRKFKVPPVVESPVAPAPPKLATGDITVPVAAAPDTIKEIPQVPVVVTETETPVEPPIPEVRKVNFKSFSRAPLGNKKISTKRKRFQ